MNVTDKVDAYCVQHFRGSVALRQLKVILLYLGEEAYQALHKDIELQLEHILTTMPVPQPVVVDGDSISDGALEDMNALDISRTADIGFSELQRILGQFISRYREEMVSGMVGKAVGTASYDETQKIIYARQELQITVLPDQLVSLQHMPMFRNACYLYVIQRKWNSHCALSGRGEDILNTGGEA